jgi:hypothetical protein
MSTIAQESNDSARSPAEKTMAKIAALGPGVHAIQKDKKGRITSCVVVGQSRISTALGKAKGLEEARKRAALSASAEFVKWLKQDVTIVENTDDETVTLLEGTEEDNQDALKESGKAVEKTDTKIKSISQGLVRGLQVLYVRTEGESKTLTVVEGWKADTSEQVKKVASDSKKDDAESAETASSKSDSEHSKSTKGEKQIQDSETTSPDADDYVLPARTMAPTPPKEQSKRAQSPSTPAESRSSDSPFSTQSANSANPSEVVVAEGVGDSADEAIKDAFRNAVRQVVGAIVDAETLVKNDEVIDDKVLTYSDGFINKYDEVPGSKQTHGGLHRIKIKATVDRRSVVAKLKSANVTVNDVDGRGMFAEVVTKREAQSDARALIAEAFADYPANVMQANIRGQPSVETNEDKTTLSCEVELSVDPAKYEAFQKRAVDLLRKVSQRQGTCFVVAKDPEYIQPRSKTAKHIQHNPNDTSSMFGEAWWTGSLSQTDDWVVVINTRHNALHDRTTWEWFHAARPAWSGGKNGSGAITGRTFGRKVVVNVAFVDSQGQEVIRDTRTLNTDYTYGAFNPPGLMSYRNPVTGNYWGVQVAFISPYTWSKVGGWNYDLIATFPLKINVTPDELKRVSAVRTEIRIQE